MAFPWDSLFHLKDERTYCIHENEQLLCQKIYPFIAGYQADRLTHDPIFTQVRYT
ncbi:hypothetical protein HMPREF0083_03734 [Aneurinibacillus aneurinilyticus ATCC 12856]|uniref:Uncharacterized protein n=1 Tax=Aneurinibacillus aneurinilyticus ATCC 12856 TaxID=649747 RepID=U1WHV7_ANEAE|nr:hypothetical protein HMPREF0083_03734 [Aneurinibacillus aneurinilyticus ATCC 12856]